MNQGTIEFRNELERKGFKNAIDAILEWIDDHPNAQLWELEERLHQLKNRFPKIDARIYAVEEAQRIKSENKDNRFLKILGELDNDR